MKLFAVITLSLFTITSFASNYECKSESTSNTYEVNEKHGEIRGYDSKGEIFLDLDGLRTDVMIYETYPSIREASFIDEDNQIVATLSNRSGEEVSILDIDGDKAVCVDK